MEFLKGGDKSFSYVTGPDKAGHNPGDDLRQYNISWDFIFQGTHTTTGGCYSVGPSRRLAVVLIHPLEALKSGDTSCCLLAPVILSPNHLCAGGYVDKLDFNVKVRYSKWCLSACTPHLICSI